MKANLIMESNVVNYESLKEKEQHKMNDSWYVASFLQEDHKEYKTKSEENYHSIRQILEKAFTNIIFFERIHRVAYHKSLENSEFKRAEKHAEKLRSQLEGLLTTTEQKELLLDLESAWNNMYGFFLEYSYCQGIEDSPEIHQELEKYGVSVVKESTQQDKESLLQAN